MIESAKRGLAIALLLTGQTQAGTLTNAQDFNAMVFGDFSTDGGDTEGRLAVGGNFTVNNSYSVSGCSSPDCSILVAPSGSQPQSSGARDDLVVGGSIQHGGGSPVSWAQLSGNARVAGGVAANVNISFLNGNQLIDHVGGDNSVDFASTQASLLQDSLTLSQLTTNGSVLTDTAMTLSLIGTDATLNVFNLSADQWGGSGKARYISTPDGSQTVINVAGMNIDLLNGLFAYGPEGCLDPVFNVDPKCSASTDFAPNTLVNYFEASIINMSGFDHQGAMLAPLGMLDASGGSVNGQAVLASGSTDSGFEFHYRANNGIPSVALGDAQAPAPVSLLLLLAGLLGMRGRLPN